MGLDRVSLGFDSAQDQGGLLWWMIYRSFNHSHFLYPLISLAFSQLDIWNPRWTNVLILAQPCCIPWLVLFSPPSPLFLGSCMAGMLLYRINGIGVYTHGVSGADCLEQIYSEQLYRVTQVS